MVDSSQIVNYTFVGAHSRPGAALSGIAGSLHLNPLPTPPLSQLLPRLHQFLHRPGAGKSVRVDNAAIAVSALVEVEDCAHAQVGEVVCQFVQMLTA